MTDAELNERFDRLEQALESIAKYSRRSSEIVELLASGELIGTEALMPVQLTPDGLVASFTTKKDR